MIDAFDDQETALSSTVALIFCRLGLSAQSVEHNWAPYRFQVTNTERRRESQRAVDCEFGG